jgi:ankyrin repeat protein
MNDLPSKLNDTYEDAMDRIQHQHEEHRQLALRVLSWITNAVRPLQVEELQHAVSVEIGDEEIDDGPLESAALIVSVCAGLVTVDAESRSVRLVHFTVEEFFKESHYKWFPDGNKVIAKTCLTYLSFDAFGKGICSNKCDPADGKSPIEARLEKYALFGYAAQNWSTHVCQASLVLHDEEVRSIAMKFLGNELKVAAAHQVFAKVGVYFPERTERLPGIHLVVKMQCEEFAMSWQACGGDINAKDRFERTALLESSSEQSLGTMRYLLDSGADVNSSDENGSTALIVAAERGWAEGVELLLGRGANVDSSNKNGRTSLIIAAQRDWAEGVELLLGRGADVDSSDRYGSTALIIAALAGWAEGVELLLGRGADMDGSDKYGSTALIIAAQRDWAEGVELLLGRGADVGSSDKNGCTALMHAAHTCSAGGAELLLGRGADPRAKNHLQATALHKICQFRSYNSDNLAQPFAGLLLEAGADIGARDCYGNTPLLLALQSGDLRLGEWLLQRGAPYRVANNEGKTPLMSSVEHDGAASVVRHLLELGACPNAVDKEGRSELITAASHHYNKEVVKLLLQQGANIDTVDRKGQSALIAAAQCDQNEEVIELLLKHEADVNGVDEDGQSALIAAARNGNNAKVVKLLLKYGADVNAADNCGGTALMYVICTGTEDFDTIKILLQRGADFNAVNLSGETALMFCVQDRCAKAANLLLEYGADVNVVDKKGMTAVMWAIRECQHAKGSKAWRIRPYQQAVGVEGWEDLVRILLSARLTEQNRKNALGMACLFQYSNQKFIRKLSKPTRAVATERRMQKRKNELDRACSLLSSSNEHVRLLSAPTQAVSPTEASRAGIVVIASHQGARIEYTFDNHNDFEEDYDGRFYLCYDDGDDDDDNDARGIEWPRGWMSSGQG